MLHVNHRWDFNGIITALYLLEEELSKKKKNINGKYKWKTKYFKTVWTKKNYQRNDHSLKSEKSHSPLLSLVFILLGLTDNKV